LALPRPDPEALAAALRDPALASEAAHMLTVMAFVDGGLDRAKIAAGASVAALRERYAVPLLSPPAGPR
jgi:hypothetical protein